MFFRCKNCNFGIDLDYIPILWICPKCGEYHYPRAELNEEQLAKLQKQDEETKQLARQILVEAGVVARNMNNQYHWYV